MKKLREHKVFGMKGVAGLIVAVVCVSAMLMSVSAATDHYGEIEYEVDGGYIYYDPSQGTISGCTSGVTNLVIPSEIEGHQVTGISSGAFSYNPQLTSITIPGSVLTIGESVFSNHKELSEVNLSEGLQVIGYSAFSRCEKLKNINIPTSVTSIGMYAFDTCPSLETITIPKNVSNIGHMAFHDCTGLTEAKILGEMLSIEEGTFWGCTNLEKVMLSDSITDIRGNAFNGCLKLSEINMPKNLINIDREAFLGCKSLKSVSFFENLSTIANEAFLDCSSLKTVTFSEGLSSISTKAFSNCSSLEKILLPASMKAIGSLCFSDCSSLSEVKICGDLETDAKHYTEAVFCGCDNIKEVTFEEGVTAIPAYLFYNNLSLTDVYLPSTIKKVEVMAFYNCENLTDFHSDGLICGTSENNPERGVEVRYWNLTSYDSLIKAYYFWKAPTEGYCGDPYNTSEGKNITWKYDKETGELTFTGKGALGKSPCYWRSFRNSITSIHFSDGITGEIPDRAFGVGNIHNHSYHTNCPDGVYLGCPNLQKVYIPEGITRIGALAFGGATSLKEVAIPSTVTKIDQSAFIECTSLESVEFLRASGDKWVRTYITSFQNTNITDLPVYLTFVGEYFNKSTNNILNGPSKPLTGKVLTEGDYIISEENGDTYKCDMRELRILVPGNAVKILRYNGGVLVDIPANMPNCTVYCASYDDQGKMLDIQSQNTLDASTQRYYFSSGNKIFKAFLVDANGRPVCESRDLIIENDV